MNTLLTVILLSSLLLAIGFAGIAVKILVKKKGEFKRHCSSADPYTGKRNGCVCGKLITDTCKDSPRYHPLEVNDELLREAGIIGK